MALVAAGAASGPRSGSIMCGRASADLETDPWLPVLGTDSPPVATITASGASHRSVVVELERSRRHRVKPVTRFRPGARRLSRVANASSPSRTSRALFERGKSFWIPLRAPAATGVVLEEAICSPAATSAASCAARRRRVGDERDRAPACMGSTLQRPPPLMRIFRPPSRVRSSEVARAPAAAANTAATNPAAPAPITATRAQTSRPLI